MSMTYEQITYESRGAVALVTLSRPEKLNAWTPRMGMEQADAIARANADPAIGAIVMTGAGRGFCAGADMEATFKSRIEGTDPGGNTAAGQGGIFAPNGIGENLDAAIHEDRVAWSQGPAEVLAPFKAAEDAAAAARG